MDYNYILGNNLISPITDTEICVELNNGRDIDIYLVIVRNFKFITDGDNL